MDAHAQFLNPPDPEVGAQSRFRVLKYIIAGLVGITVNLGTYRFLVADEHFEYLLGSVVAVSCSTIVGFLLQKYWTFEERSAKRAPIQFTMYTFVALFNIALNTLIVYILIDGFHLYYLLAQAIAAAMVAVGSFFVYREIIFKNSHSQKVRL